MLLVTIRGRRSPASEPEIRLLQKYIERAARYLPCTHRDFATEAAFLTELEKRTGRTPAYLILADSHGEQVTSEHFASTISSIQDSGTQQLILAVGPADGWSVAAKQRARKLVAFGQITLPHELAAIVLAEQVYRALTIRAGHPYHSGH